MFSMILVVALAAMGGRTPAVRLQIALTFERGAPAPLETSVVEEAARVWAPYGIALRDATRDSAPASDSLTLHVRIVDRPDPGHNDHALASIGFRSEVPDPAISLYAGTAADLVSSAAAGQASHWPAGYCDALVSRVLGRALAHEIGHYLLRTREHSRSGLMRAVQPILELMEVRDANLALSDEEATTLRDGLDAGLDRRDGAAPVTPGAGTTNAHKR